MEASGASKRRTGPQSHGAPVDPNQNLEVEEGCCRSPAPNSVCQVESSVYSMCNARVVQRGGIFTRYSVDCARCVACTVCNVQSCRRAPCALCTVDSVHIVCCVHGVLCVLHCSSAECGCVHCVLSVVCAV